MEVGAAEVALTEVDATEEVGGAAWIEGAEKLAAALAATTNVSRASVAERCRALPSVAERCRALPSVAERCMRKEESHNEKMKRSRLL